MRLSEYSFGKILIDGILYTSDVLIVDGKAAEWWRKEGHLLQEEDLEEVWKSIPDVLVVGCGASGIMRIDDSVSLRCAQEGVELIRADTDEAVDIFNRLSGKRKTACGLHLTC
ncbi:MAG: hypothetical protein JXJ19_05050 [Elusimicrobia bacterium]|nr:hypothetical protein [Elusimicrobiota bacterium]